MTEDKKLSIEVTGEGESLKLFVDGVESGTGNAEQISSLIELKIGEVFPVAEAVEAEAPAI